MPGWPVNQGFGVVSLGLEQILDSLVPKTVGGGRLDVKEVVKSSERKSLSCSATPP